MSSRANPWEVIDPDDPPYVIAEDAPYVRAFNATLEADSPYALDLSLLPDPWADRLDAPVVLLNLNPGRSPGDLAAHQMPPARAAIVANLRQDDARYPLFYLDPVSPLWDAPGGRWWRMKVGPLVKQFDAQVVARHVVSLEFHGYHSVSYRHLPVTLPSQWFVFDALRAALERDATVIVLRGWDAWRVAVPELGGYGRVFTTRSTRNSTVSPRNCPEGWPQVVAAIEAAAG